MKVEVSAIMEKHNLYRTMAISPCGNIIYVYNRYWRCWIKVVCPDAMRHWNSRISADRKIWRGIFFIEVPFNEA